jgi:hypothetical protein
LLDAVSQLDEAAERIHERNLLGRPAIRLEEPRTQPDFEAGCA